MTKDIQILPYKQGKFNFTVLGTSEDSGLMLLQRVFTLLLADGEYRQGAASANLLKFMAGGNYPADGVMNSLLGVCCADALSSLSSEDRAHITSLVGEWRDRTMTCTLTFRDGTTLTGAINV